MAHVEQVVSAPARKVYEVLADGWMYSDWMLGATHVETVDPNWPEPGSRIRHKIGMGRASLHQDTLVLENEPDSRLVLRPKLWPLGASRMTITLIPADDTTTRVSVDESFDKGPARWFGGRVDDLVLGRFRRESLRRLAELAVHRQRDR